MRRGEAEGVLRVAITVDGEECVERLKRHYVYGNTPCGKLVAEAVEDGYKRLLEPSIETEFAGLGFYGNCHRREIQNSGAGIFPEGSQRILLPASGAERWKDS